MFTAVMGWIGTVGTIGAYVMLSRGRWNATSIRYGVLNLLGGLLGATGSAAYGAWPSVASNLIWSGVALHSIVATLLTRRALAIRNAEPVTQPVVGPEPEPVAEPVAYVAPDPWPDTLKMPAVMSAA